jgi:hypothetical protein
MTITLTPGELATLKRAAKYGMTRGVYGSLPVLALAGVRPVEPPENDATPAPNGIVAVQNGLPPVAPTST